MKKLLSIVIAVMMSVSVLAVATMSAFAVESPTATTAANTDVVIQVNGSDSKDVTYTIQTVNGNLTITFTYDGEGTLIGWENNLTDIGFVEGQDFTAVENEDGTYTITLTSQEAIDAFNNGEVIVNAIVKFPDGSSTSVTVKPNGSNTSPNTGLATSVIAGSIAVAGAGIAVLSATKKRDAE